MWQPREVIKWLIFFCIVICSTNAVALANRDLNLFADPPPEDISKAFRVVNLAVILDCVLAAIIAIFRKRKMLAAAMAIAFVLSCILGWALVAASDSDSLPVLYIYRTVLILVDCCFAFVPTIIAFSGKHKRKFLILLLNLPMTFMPPFWGALFNWALNKTSEEQPSNES